ncbi:MerR family transcriptional regulator [Chakrabartyella piscis]|uniref:MerR family transcriptional regulator n=1 Tax=Chakrabartyella piscis TaxID=2918914 RepID=UPI0029584098|nr:MerR family transcriptional regulator [Chakrabartyella piscis]
MSTEIKYSIREVAEICSIPSKTLRYYDEIQLVVPEFRDDVNRYRYYSKQQMVTLCIVRKLRSLGFGLKEIHNILDGNNAEKLELGFETKLNEVQNEIHELQKKYADIRSFLDRLKMGVDILNVKDLINTDPISIVEIPTSTLVYTRKTMKNYANAEVSLKRWVEILDLCDSLEYKSKGNIIVTYYSNPLEQFLYSDTDIEFATPITTDSDNENCRTYGGFTAATAIHIGDYADIMQTHIRLIQWINQNQYKVCGPISEEFIISPLDVTNTEEHVTKVIVPVVKTK